MARRFLLVGKFPEPCFFWGKSPNPYYYEKKERHNMDNVQESTNGRKREIVLRLCVTEAERDMIYEKMRQYQTNNFGAYARKILIDGYVINTDFSDLKAVCAEMQKIGVNVNQIAKRVNGTSRIYEQDIDEIQRGVAEIWRLLKLSLSRPR
jgi:hypothetical protein